MSREGQVPVPTRGRRWHGGGWAVARIGIIRCAMSAAIILAFHAVMAAPALARDHLVTDAAMLAVAAGRAAPGDTIILADGEWRDVDLQIVAQGTARRPIIVRPETAGGVAITGRSILRVAGRHLVVRDLLFRNGYPADGAAIVSRVGEQWAEDVRFTGIVIDRFSNPGRRNADHWVALYGRNIIFERSHIEGKQNAGATFVVMREDNWPLDNRVWIRDNYFGPRPPLGSNTGETIRIGTSENSLTDSLSVIEGNIFDRASGEVEIVSIKSGGNVIRGNLFLRSQGSLVLRHGNGNLVERNVFLGAGEANTGGIRVINEGQTVRGNYLEGLTGSGFTGALAVMNGVPNSVINRYHQVRGALISRNSFIEPSAFILGAGASEERSAAPVDVVVSDNLVASGRTAPPFQLLVDLGGFVFRNNVTDQPAPESLGFRAQPFTMTRARNGLLYPVERALEAVGAPRDLVVPTRANVGAPWYGASAAPQAEARVVSVGTVEELVSAIAGAADGDTIDLGSASLMVDAPLLLRRAITLRGSGARLAFRGDTLFLIEEGGSLHLRGLTISGAAAQRASGNAVIRTSASPILTNYMISIEQTVFEALDAAPAFDLIVTTPGTMAALIRISDSSITGLSGTLLAASSERGPAGVYAAEDVVIERARLSRVGRIADLLRDGTDESTFGPRVAFSGNLVVDSGPLLLSGVQVTAITNNRFIRSNGVGITHSVGDPLTHISGNIFDQTPAPAIAELQYRGPQRAILRDNIQQ